MKLENLTISLFISDEKKCFELFRQIRWRDSVYCPKFGSFGVYNCGVEGKRRIVVLKALFSRVEGFRWAKCFIF